MTTPSNVDDELDQKLLAIIEHTTLEEHAMVELIKNVFQAHKLQWELEAELKIRKDEARICLDQAIVAHDVDADSWILAITKRIDRLQDEIDSKSEIVEK